jgi:IclR family KDG regulon transcriptional repressor
MSDSKSVNSILRGAEILRCVSEGIDRISDLSKSTRMSKSTVHRLLKSLTASGLARQNEATHRYYLGPLAHRLVSQPIIAHQNLIATAYNEMRQLMLVTRETVNLNIPIGTERMCLEEIESPENIKCVSGKGSIAPLYSGSAGKMLLAELNPAQLKIILKNVRFIGLQKNTITNQNDLLIELEKVKKQGYATSFSERIAGAASISIPIKNYICPVALSIMGTENRFQDKMMDFLQDLKASSARISRKLV